MAAFQIGLDMSGVLDFPFPSFNIREGSFLSGCLDLEDTFGHVTKRFSIETYAVKAVKRNKMFPGLPPQA